MITRLNGQNLQWHQTDSTGFDGKLITHDGANNIYVKVQPVWNFPDFGKISVIKYNAQGDKLWTFLYPELPVSGLDLYSMVTTSSGSTYCAGLINPDYYTQYALVMKITPSGNLAWAHSFDVDSSAYYYSKLALDEDENVYVTGAHFNPIVSKLDSAGNFLWTQQGDSIANPGDIVLDNDGNVITLAYKYPETYLISAFTKDGIFKWSTSYISNNIYNVDIVHRVRTDNNNNVYFLGYVNNAPKQQVTIGRINADGSLSWVHEDSISQIYFTDMEIDDSNNIYTCGNVQASNVLLGTSTILKLTETGDTLFQNFYDTGGEHGNWFQNIELKNNDIYICGTSYGNSSDGFLTMKEDANGNIIWTESFSNGPDEDNYARNLSIDEQGNVLVTGGTHLTYYYQSVALTLKYADTSGISTHTTLLPQPEEVSVFPNPASDIISVICQNMEGTIHLIDLYGEEMLSQKISNPLTQIDVSKLPSGVYLLENKNANKTIIKKIVKE